MRQPMTHVDFRLSWWDEQMMRELRRRRKRLTAARTLREAGVILAGIGMAAAVAGLWWPAMARWPLTVALIGVPALLLAALVLGRR